MRRLWNDERGGALVEFALVLPLLMLVLMGMVDFAQAWHTHHVMADAAREGARWAVVDDGLDKVGTADAPGTVPAAILDRFARSGLQTDGAWDPANYTADCTGWAEPGADVTQPTIYGCGWGDDNGTDARVVLRAPHPFAFVGGVLALVGGGTLGTTTLSTNFVMRNE